jgi:short-subunit dehydrogenase
MRTELAKEGIYVTMVCPALMCTGSHLNAFFTGQHKRQFVLFSMANALLSTSSDRAAREIEDSANRDSTSTLSGAGFSTILVRSLLLAPEPLPGYKETIMKKPVDEFDAILLASLELETAIWKKLICQC